MTTVALVRSDNRRGAVAEALALIADDLRGRVAEDVVLTPQLDHPGPVHFDALSATVDALLAAGARRVRVAPMIDDRPDRLGYRAETFGRPVDYPEGSAWDRSALASGGSARVARAVASADCRVSIATMRTHGLASVALGLANGVSGVHPDDRASILGRDRGGWVGRIRRFARAGRDRPDAWRRFGPPEIGLLRDVDAVARDLVSLAKSVGPGISVVDGFDRLGTVVAGVDPVAVDSISAAVMGFDPLEIAHIQAAEAAGLGVADLDSIAIVGDPLAPGRRIAPHPDHAVARHWARWAELFGRGSAIPSPHARPARARQPLNDQ